MPSGLGNFDNEANNPNNVTRRARTKDRNSFNVHPLCAVFVPHNSKLARLVRGTIRPEGLHRDFVKTTPILRMHALQEQLKFSGYIARNSENVSQLV